MSIEVDQDGSASWGAIFAGAACAAALSFILLILGFGLGISAVSPWSNTSASLTAIGISSIVWVALTQIVASPGPYFTDTLLRTDSVSRSAIQGLAPETDRPNFLFTSFNTVLQIKTC